MALTEITIDPTDPAQELEVELAGRLYTLRVTYNTRMAGWVMDILDAEGATLVTGIRLVADWGTLDQFVDARLPQGQLFVLDMGGKGQDPGEDDLGDRVILVFDDGQ